MIVGGAVGIQMWRKGEEYRDLEDAPSDLKKLVSNELCVKLARHYSIYNFLNKANVFYTEYK